jgi:hypothetical protein
LISFLPRTKKCCWPACKRKDWQASPGRSKCWRQAVVRRRPTCSPWRTSPHPAPRHSRSACVRTRRADVLLLLGRNMYR